MYGEGQSFLLNGLRWDFRWVPLNSIIRREIDNWSWFQQAGSGKVGHQLSSVIIPVSDIERMFFPDLVSMSMIYFLCFRVYSDLASIRPQATTLDQHFNFRAVDDMQYVNDTKWVPEIIMSPGVCSSMYTKHWHTISLYKTISNDFCTFHVIEDNPSWISLFWLSLCCSRIPWAPVLQDWTTSHMISSGSGA